MGTKKTILKNAAWSWAGMAVGMVTGFVTAPFLVRRLGETNYGLWIVIASFTSYFGMLDLGVRGAVGRQMAFRLAQGDRRGFNAILSTSLSILAGAGAIALLSCIGASLLLTRLFEVPPGEVAAARMALLLVGVNLALWLPLNVFDATLWAFQRFDLINIVDIVAVSIRTALTFLLIGDGYGIVTLAWLNLVTLAGVQAVKAVISFGIDPSLRTGFGLMESEAARGLLGYGIWYFLISAARTLTTQISPLIIGIRLGIGLVTPFSVASRLVGYAGALIMAGTGVLTPVATALQAEGNHDRQRWLFAEGGKYCLALSLFFVSLFLLLGRPLITSWMGPGLASSSYLLVILALGEALPLSQWVTHGVILGMGRHRPLALANFAECAAAVVLAGLLSGPFGLTGVCVAFAIPATLSRGIFQIVYGCRLLKMPLRQHFSEVVAPVVGVMTLPAAGLGAMVAWSPPRTTAEFFVFVVVYSLISFTACALLLVGQKRLRNLGAGLARRISGAEVC